MNSHINPLIKSHRPSAEYRQFSHLDQSNKPAQSQGIRG